MDVEVVVNSVSLVIVVVLACVVLVVVVLVIVELVIVVLVDVVLVVVVLVDVVMVVVVIDVVVLVESPKSHGSPPMHESVNKDEFLEQHDVNVKFRHCRSSTSQHPTGSLHPTPPKNVPPG